VPRRQAGCLSGSQAVCTFTIKASAFWPMTGQCAQSPKPMMVNATGLLGAVIFIRHGDRSEFFQDPLTYNPTETTLTPLGTVQELQLGGFLRERYINNDSDSNIAGVQFPVADIDQIVVRADAAGEGSTILSSTAAAIAGLFPPTPAFSITLANGTTVEGALGGNQFIPGQALFLLYMILGADEEVESSICQPKRGHLFELVYLVSSKRYRSALCFLLNGILELRRAHAHLLQLSRIPQRSDDRCTIPQCPAALRRRPRHELHKHV
jgi:hypothetical protein